MLEDNISDVELVKLQLLKEKISFNLFHASNKEEYIKQINSNGANVDIILSDYRLIEFTGLDALDIALKKMPLIPFIIVTGTLDEETAAATIKAGAWDYVVKERLSRLIPAIKNALELKKEKEEKHAAIEKLRNSEERFRILIEQAPDAFYLCDMNQIIVRANESSSKLSGFSQEELLNKSIIDLIADHTSKFLKNWTQIENPGQSNTFITKFLKKDGSSYPVEIKTTIILVNDVKYRLSFARDISEHIKAQKEIQKRNDKLIELNKQISDYKIMALRSIMNPHFIFNSLNSIQYYIGHNKKEMAINYLSLFSKLIRNVLDSSINPTINLETELEILKYYIELEKVRFENSFDFQLNIHENLDINNIEVPSLIFQPYVENAIIHGLTPKKNNGLLKIDLEKRNNFLICTIEDNGIGRQESNKIKKNKHNIHKSVGLSITSQRLEIINKTNNVAVNIIDLKNNKNLPCGTKVELAIELSV